MTNLIVPGALLTGSVAPNIPLNKIHMHKIIAELRSF